MIPASIKVIGQASFQYCEALTSLTFENGSVLERIDLCAFYDTSHQILVLPRTVIFLGENCFAFSTLRSGTFSDTHLKEITIPNRLLVIDKRCLWGCRSLESLSFEARSKLKRIESYGSPGWNLRIQFRILVGVHLTFDSSPFHSIPLRRTSEFAMKCSRMSPAVCWSAVLGRQFLS
jgi:hypothetical protein